MTDSRDSQQIKKLNDEIAVESAAEQVDENRRSLMSKLVAGAGVIALGSTATVSQAEEVKEQAEEENELRFPGDPPEHKVVYQFNKSDDAYQKHVLFSVGAVLRKYGDNVKIVVTCFGEGIHILGKKPGRPVSTETKERVSSLSVYGVEFHACGNTMKSLKWTEKDLLPFVSVVEVGAVDLIELQEDGFSYISW